FGGAGIACGDGLVHLRVGHHGAVDGGQMIVRLFLGLILDLADQADELVVGHADVAGVVQLPQQFLHIGLGFVVGFPVAWFAYPLVEVVVDQQIGVRAVAFTGLLVKTLSHLCIGLGLGSKSEEQQEQYIRQIGFHG